jgi:hypothetical protein
LQGWITIILEALPIASRLLPILGRKFNSFKDFNARLDQYSTRLDSAIMAYNTEKKPLDQAKKEYQGKLKLKEQATVEFNAAKEVFRVESSDDLMVEVLGGQEAFKKLPSFELKGRVGTTNFGPFCYDGLMNVPVMRGVDQLGKSLIFIRTKSGSQRFPHTSIVLGRTSLDKESWSFVTNNVFEHTNKGALWGDPQGSIIRRGQYVPRTILALNELITTGKCEVESELNGKKRVLELA